MVILCGIKMNKPKIIAIKKDWCGITLPTNQNGHAGRSFEQKMIADGYDLNTGKGPDGGDNFDFEVKTRDKDATSPLTTGTMLESEIIKTDYKDSVIYKKLQQQFRVKTKDNIIVDNDVYDFSKPQIQELLEEAYETSRSNLKLGYINNGNTATGTYWGYFEKKRDTNNSWQFRHSDRAMKKLEAMAKSTFNSIFDY